MDENVLLNNLSDLKECISNYSSNSKIFFFDKNSYFVYLGKITHNGKSVKTILNNIYGSIPLLLSDEAYEYFKESITDFEVEKFEIISKTDFFDFALKHKNNWEYIEKLCVSINKYLY